MLRADNPYLEAIERNLPRVLALFDTDPTSESFGYGDRYHWAWGLIDFSNGTFQGMVHGLARLVHSDLLPSNIDKSILVQRIKQMIFAVEKIKRKDGSLEEAFPYEGSFCVTALVAYDVLTAMQLLRSEFSSDTFNRFIEIVEPLINYLHIADENHAFISNHLATAVAALYKWHLITGKGSTQRADDILERILSKQSNEGWYLEYEGFDPGYQTLCTYYLADVLEMSKSEQLKASLIRSVKFLQYFVHPDGSLGGVYGSRNTRFYYPAGLEFLSIYSEEAMSISLAMQESIKENLVVGLDSIDEPNLTPMFNAYCWAATLYNESCDNNLPASNNVLPSRDKLVAEYLFEQAGIYINSGEKHYTIVNYLKGGVIYHFLNDKLKYVNCGKVFQDKNNTIYSTQRFIKKNKIVNKNETNLIIESGIYKAPKSLFKPWQMIILRMLNISFLRNYWLREIVKRIMVRILITNDPKQVGRVIREITLGPKLKVTDNEETSLTELSKEDYEKYFVSIHMASKGYWQKQDTSI